VSEGQEEKNRAKDARRAFLARANEREIVHVDNKQPCGTDWWKEKRWCGFF
jgi:hypothetical protein